MQKQKQAFTLVELIVVITILSILGTIAFISMQGYSRDARDTTRISDISNIETSLELFSLDAGKYPLPDNAQDVTYSGSIIVWRQGTVGDIVSTNLGRNINKKPVDPLIGKEYIYSVLENRSEYELMSLYEGDLQSNNIIFNNTYAAENWTVRIDGTYNGIFVKTSGYIIPTPSIITSETLPLSFDATAIKSQVLNGGKNIPDMGSSKILKSTGSLSFPGFKIYTGSITKDSSYSDKLLVYQILGSTYTGSSMINKGKIINLLGKSSVTEKIVLIETLLLDNSVTKEVIFGVSDINKVICEEANWMWVDSTTDVYIGDAQGNGFCISPRYGDWNADSALGDGGISWNGWGDEPLDYYNGWTASGSLGTSDTGNPTPNYGQTIILDSEVSYNCKALGTAGFDYSGSDDIVGRMKWLATTGDTYTEARSIDWITGLVPHTVGVNPQAVPALYIADCIDGVKDLGTDMLYTDTGSVLSTITYSEYSTDETTDTDLSGTGNITYLNRQKYLTAWTQRSGSHLPSAFSYITNGYTSAADDDGDFLVGGDRGEYQVACEAGLLTDADDNLDSEQILVSAIGYTDGKYWGSSTRSIGYDACGDQHYNITSARHGARSARFVLRP